MQRRNRGVRHRLHRLHALAQEQRRLHLPFAFHTPDVRQGTAPQAQDPPQPHAEYHAQEGPQPARVLGSGRARKAVLRLHGTFGQAQFFRARGAAGVPILLLHGPAVFGPQGAHPARHPQRQDTDFHTEDRRTGLHPDSRPGAGPAARRRRDVTARSGQFHVQQEPTRRRQEAGFPQPPARAHRAPYLRDLVRLLRGTHRGDIEGARPRQHPDDAHLRELLQQGHRPRNGKVQD